jgi:hypothetical protein
MAMAMAVSLRAVRRSAVGARDAVRVGVASGSVGSVSGSVGAARAVAPRSFAALADAEDAAGQKDVVCFA